MKYFRTIIPVLIFHLIIWPVIFGLQNGLLHVSAQQTNTLWTDPINLSNTGGTTSPSLIIDSFGVFHAVWNEIDYGTGYARSTDGGNTWSDSSAASFPFLGTIPKFIPDQSGLIHAFWLAERNQLFYSSTTNESFGFEYAWQTPQLIAESAISFDIDIFNGNIQVAYIRNIESSNSPTGVYVKSSANSGRNWSFASLLYTSRYFRNLTVQNAHIDVASSSINGNPTLFITWDQPFLKEIFMSSSTDQGLTWTEPEMVSEPDGSVLDAPNQLSTIATSTTALRLWQSGLSMSNDCQLNYEILGFDGSTWSETFQVSNNPTPCASDIQIFPTADGFQAVVLMLTQENPYLLAWNGETWSNLIEQPSLGSFINPDSLEIINLSCQFGAYLDDSISVVGCDVGELRDSWFMQRSLSDIDKWFPGAVVWSEETVIYSNEWELDSPALISDSFGQMYAFWSQHNPDPDNPEILGNPLNKEIYYSFWDGERWFEPINFRNPPNTGAVSPSLHIQNQEKVSMVWESTPFGEIYYSSARMDLVVSLTDWSEPTKIPVPNLPASSPAISSDPQGNLYVVYSVPINEQRGIYLSKSTDEGVTWSEPLLVFDAEADNWIMVDHPQLAVTDENNISVLFTQFNTSGEIIPTGLYYTQSRDGGATWSTSEVIREQTVVWSSITPLGGLTLHRAWQAKNANSLELEQEFSQDGGQTWQGLSDLPNIIQGAGSVSFFLDPFQQFHWLQVEKESDQSATLAHFMWDGINWKPYEPVSLRYTPNPIPNTISGNVTINGLLGTMYFAELTNAQTEELENGISFLNKMIPISGEITPPSGLNITPNPTEQPSPTNTPDLEPQPTSTPDFSSLPPPQGPGVSSGNIFGLIIGGVAAVALVLVPFGLHIYRQRRID